MIGVWATMVGFAAFLLLWTQLRPEPAVFLLGLGVAALVAYVAEYLKELIQRPGTHRVTLPHVLVLLLLLAVFELFAMAGHVVVENFWHRAHAPRGLTSDVVEFLKPMGDVAGSAVVELGFLAGLWAVVAAIIGRRLSRIVLANAPVGWRSVRHGLREGFLAGVVIAPWVVVAYLLAARTTASLYHLGRARPGLAAAIIGAAAVVVWISWQRRWWRGLQILAAVVLGYGLVTIPDDVDRVWKVALLAVVIWGVPSLVLGAVAPLLRTTADQPKLWGFLAFAAAALLMGLTLARLAHPWCYAVSVVLALIGLMFVRGASLQDYWPLAALAMAAMVSGFMVIVQYATFLGVFVQLHAIHSLPSLQSDRIKQTVQILERVKLFDLPDQDPDIRKVVDRSRHFDLLPPDRQLDQLEEIDATLARLEARWPAVQAAQYRAMAEGRFWGIVSPGQDVAQLYRDLAEVVLTTQPVGAVQSYACPGPGDPRFADLDTRAERMIEAEVGLARAQEARRAREASIASAIEQALREGPVSEDTASYGLEIGQLAADLHRFAQRASDGSRGQEASHLLMRIDALLAADGYTPTPLDQTLSGLAGGADLPGSPLVTPDQRRVRQLLTLRRQLVGEMRAPGSGDLRPPRPFAGDARALPWRPQPRPELPASYAKPRTRLEWLETARAAVWRERGRSAGCETWSGPVIAPDSQRSIATMFPDVAQLAKLQEVRTQLYEARQKAEKLDRWLTEPAAVTLELALVGSFGFWMTVGLLAAWRNVSPEPPDGRH